MGVPRTTVSKIVEGSKIIKGPGFDISIESRFQPDMLTASILSTRGQKPIWQQLLCSSLVVRSQCTLEIKKVVDRSSPDPIE